MLQSPTDRARPTRRSWTGIRPAPRPARGRSPPKHVAQKWPRFWENGMHETKTQASRGSVSTRRASGADRVAQASCCFHPSAAGIRPGLSSTDLTVLLAPPSRDSRVMAQPSKSRALSACITLACVGLRYSAHFM
ncbi:hypothetical protein FJ471_04040 [Mesorhizobium sp. B2-7-1]|nr:hypothetical protein FJ471_04040 [Mesorhizobium sp. B2-7-1]